MSISSPGAGGADFGDGAAGRVYAEGDAVSRPQVLQKVEPEYSEAARKQKFSRTVALRIVVGAEGKVASAKVVGSVGLGLRPWKFRPGTKTGSPSPWR